MLESAVVYGGGRRGALARHVEHGRGESGEFALAENVRRQNDARSVPEVFGAEEQGERYGYPNEDRDIDRLAEAGPGALILQGVEQRDEFVLVEVAVAAGAELEGMEARRRLDGNVRNKRDRGIRISVRWRGGERFCLFGTGGCGGLLAFFGRGRRAWGHCLLLL